MKIAKAGVALAEPGREGIIPKVVPGRRRALLINQGDWLAALFHSPLAIGLFVSVIVLTYFAIKLQIGERLSGMGAAGAAKEAKEATGD